MIIRNNWKYWKSLKFELFCIWCDLPIIRQEHYNREFTFCLTLFNTTVFYLSISRRDIYLTIFEIQFLWGEDARIEKHNKKED